MGPHGLACCRAAGEEEQLAGADWRGGVLVVMGIVQVRAVHAVVRRDGAGGVHLLRS